ncbi:MAG: hypothetical protein ACT4O9_13195 [Blastocatellia bacterium]
MDSYLDRLHLSGEEKAKLDDLAADTPAALLAMMEADSKVFERLLGKERALQIMSSLDELIDETSRRIIREKSANVRGLGAIVLENSPKLPPVKYDPDERNRLFDELQYWQSQDSSSDEVNYRISNLTERLNELLSKN